MSLVLPMNLLILSLSLSRRPVWSPSPLGQLPTREDPYKHFAALNIAKEKFEKFLLCPATQKSYQTGKYAFLDFYKRFQVWRLGSVYPTNETILCYFAPFLAKTVQHSTIKTYLVAV